MGISKLPPHRAALLVLCSGDGTVVQVLHNDFDLKHQIASGHRLTEIVAGDSAKKADRFLRAVAARQSVLDWQLDLPLRERTAPLYFTGIPTGPGILLLAIEEPLLPVHPKTRSLASGLSQVGGPSLLARPLRKTGASHALEAAAHDLRNPASGILAASEFLIEDVQGRLEEHHLNLLRSIQSSSRLMLRRIGEMLQIPPDGAHQPGMHFQLTDLASLVVHSAAANGAAADSRNVHLEVITGGPVPHLELDSRKMGQAIQALLRNVIQCSRPGSRIEILVNAPGAEATITVRDPGPGLPAAGPRAARTALTLGTVRRIVERHHGTMVVEQDVRKGSSFTVHLPLAAASDGRSGRVVRKVATG